MAFKFNKQYAKISSPLKFSDQPRSATLFIGLCLLLYPSQPGCAHNPTETIKSGKGSESAVATKELPQVNANIIYGDNGTPSLIKGDNLSSILDDEPGFQKLREKNLYVEIAFQFLQSQRGLLKLNDPNSELEKTDLTVDDMQFKHIKTRQVVNGVPIWGKEIIVHLNRKNQVYMVNGNFLPSVTIDTTPRLTGAEAVEAAMKAAPDGPSGWRSSGAEIQVYFVEPGEPRLVYVVTLVKGIAGREFYFINANDGAVLHNISGTPSQNKKNGQGYGIKLY